MNQKQPSSLLLQYVFSLLFYELWRNPNPRQLPFQDYVDDLADPSVLAGLTYEIIPSNHQHNGAIHQK